MDKFEEFGKRIDEELQRLRHFLEDEVAPETERRGAIFLARSFGEIERGRQQAGIAHGRSRRRRCQTAGVTRRPVDFSSCPSSARDAVSGMRMRSAGWRIFDVRLRIAQSRL